MRVGVGALLGALVLSAPATAAAPLQPGASLGGCTMNWVYDGLDHLAGRVFLGTANHCVDGVGQRVADGSGTEIGVVAFTGDYENADWHADYALIEVDPAHHARVEPSMAGHPKIPAKPAVQDEMEAGDLLQMSGWGGLTAQTQDTREKRQAILTQTDGSLYWSMAPVSGGDSGGPVAHVETRAALGIVSGWVFTQPGNLMGPTVAAIIADAKGRGFPVRMRLAGEPAPSPPTPPAPTPPPPPPAQPHSPPPGASNSKAKPRKKRKACPKGKKRSKKTRRCVKRKRR